MSYDSSTAPRSFLRMVPKKTELPEGAASGGKLISTALFFTIFRSKVRKHLKKNLVLTLVKGLLLTGLNVAYEETVADLRLKIQTKCSVIHSFKIAKLYSSMNWLASSKNKGRLLWTPEIWHFMESKCELKLIYVVENYTLMGFTTGW